MDTSWRLHVITEWRSGYGGKLLTSRWKVDRGRGRWEKYDTSWRLHDVSESSSCYGGKPLSTKWKWIAGSEARKRRHFVTLTWRPGIALWLEWVTADQKWKVDCRLRRSKRRLFVTLKWRTGIALQLGVANRWPEVKSGSQAHKIKKGDTSWRLHVALE